MNKSTLEILRQRKAATGFLTANEAFVAGIYERRAAGLTRQRTTAEIMPCEHGVWCPDTRCEECRSNA